MMIINSFIKDYFGLRPIQVEVILTTGLPQISILGLPDTVIKESAKRIQSALIAQGYRMPKAKQVLVNLKPNEIKKTSLGIDLAIALGILWESGQREKENVDVYIYGELSLSGEVSAPKDIFNAPKINKPILTGSGFSSYPFTTKILPCLKGNISDGTFREDVVSLQRPSIKKELSFNKTVAEYLKIVAVGEHSTLLAGPAGSGKTTFAESICNLLRAPNSEEARDIIRIGNYFHQKPKWRPVVRPHHSSTPISMVGGGAPPRPGEIVRSHRGVLILDELLEFDTKVQAMLREPIEQKKISLNKGVYHREFPCDFFLLGTTNLCRCGEYVPNLQNKCRCSGRQLRMYLEKLSGPFVDRFDSLLLTHDWHKNRTQESLVNMEDIFVDCENIRDFIKNNYSTRNLKNRMNTENIISSFHSKYIQNIFPVFRSHRRKLAFIKLLRTVADINFSVKIQDEHVHITKQMTYDNFVLIRDGMAF